MTSAADATMSGAATEEIQLEVADDIVSGTEAVTNDMQSPAEGTGAQSLPAAVQSLPAAAQSLPAAAQGDEDMDQFSHGSLQVVAQSDMDQFSDGSFQVCDGPQNRTLLYRSQMVLVEGGPSHYRPPSAAQIPAPVNADGSEPAAAQEATTQSQPAAAQEVTSQSQPSTAQIPTTQSHRCAWSLTLL